MGIMETTTLPLKPMFAASAGDAVNEALRKMEKCCKYAAWISAAHDRTPHNVKALSLPDCADVGCILWVPNRA